MTSGSGPAHRRTHNLLLISKLLSQREQVSPLTLVLDTLEQTAKPLIAEYLRRAKVCVVRSAVHSQSALPALRGFHRSSSKC